MAEWKKIITSGSNAELNQITASGNVQFDGAINLGNASDTTLTRASAGDVNIEGNIIYRAGGTDVPVSDGGTGQDSYTDGQLLIGNDSGNTLTKATLTPTSNEIEISNGNGSIQIGLPNDVTIGQDLTVTRNISANNITASGDISSSGNGSFTGTLRVDDNVDFNGQLDVFGQTNLDNTDIDGTFKMDGTTFDVNGTDAVTIDTTDTTSGITIGTSTSAVPITIGHGTSEVTIGDNLTIVGDLTVQGDTTTLSTTNTEVKDQFLFLNSGSNSGDAGLVVQNSVNNSGSAFVFDDSEDRWGFATGSVAKTATSVTPSGYAVAAVTNDNVAEYRKNGNIRVEGGEIFIYVE
jgi:hypothetical protein